MVRLNFAERLNARMNAQALPQAGPATVERAMLELQRVSERLAVVAAPVHQRVVRPMVDELTRRFANAIADHYRTPHGFVSECRLGHTSRYPAAARLAVALEWDPGSGAAWLRYAAELMPALIPFDGMDRYDIALTPPGPAEVRHWVQKKLLAFVAAYLELVEYSPAYRIGEARTDPVCGMQVISSGASHRYTYDGHTYWLCSSVCREVLAANPALFLTGRVSLIRDTAPGCGP